MKQIGVIVLALFLDLVSGDPPNQLHPVAFMGRWLSRGQDLAPPQKRFLFGLGWTLAGIMLFAWPWHIVRNIKSNVPVALYLLASAVLLKSVFAYRNLRQAVADVAKALAVSNLGEARRLTGWHLVSRDTRELTAEEVAGAAIESLAENLTDSVVAPLWAYTVAGLPAAWAYRFVNTADAMWGYRTPQFEQLGKFPARLDDLLNWLPARLTGWLIVAASGLSGQDAGCAARTMLGQHHLAASPNAGWTMSAMAGALRITLSKRNYYELVGGSNALNPNLIQQALHVADICVGLNLIIICLFLLVRPKKRKG